MSDRFDTLADTPAQPARMAFSIAPHATNEVDPLPKAIFVGTGGTLTARFRHHSTGLPSTQA